MSRCPTCHERLRRGSTYCPRCGAVIDDGLDRQRIRWVVPLIVGLAAVLLFAIFLLGH